MNYAVGGFGTSNQQPMTTIDFPTDYARGEGMPRPKLPAWHRAEVFKEQAREWRRLLAAGLALR